MKQLLSAIELKMNNFSKKTCMSPLPQINPRPPLSVSQIRKVFSKKIYIKQ